MAKISLVMPSHQGAHFLTMGSMFSACNQTHPVDEIILYDNGKGEQALDSNLSAMFYHYLGANVIKLPNVGNELKPAAAWARWNAAQHATCEYLWFVDHDVWVFYDCLQEMVKTKERTGCNVVVGTRIEINVPDTFGAMDWLQDTRQRPNDVRVILAPYSCMLVDTDFWIKVCGHREHEMLPEDCHNTDLLLTVSAWQEKGTYVCKNAVYYHMKENPSPWQVEDAGEEYLRHYLGTFFHLDLVEKVIEKVCHIV